MPDYCWTFISENPMEQESIPVGCVPPLANCTCFSVATKCQYWEGVGPQVSKFEWVFSDDHQMSLRAGVRGQGLWGSISDVWDWGQGCHV